MAIESGFARHADAGRARGAKTPVASDGYRAESALSTDSTDAVRTVLDEIARIATAGAIMQQLGADICTLLNAERLTIYAVSDDGEWLISTVRMGLESFKEIRLRIGDTSIAGYCALHKTVLNIHDAYDERELERLGPRLAFFKEVDRRTGYRTRQVLAAPLLRRQGRELAGVVQVINSRNGAPFPPWSAGAIERIGEALAAVLRPAAAAP